MRPALRPVALLVPLLLVGCTMPGDEGPGESQEGPEAPDLSTYDGGPGLAFALTNGGDDPFTFTIVATRGENEVASFAGEIAPGATEEKWFTLESGAYNVTMDYAWRGKTGSVKTGDDERQVDLGGCAGATRLHWRLVQTEETVGAAYLGAACADAP